MFNHGNNALPSADLVKQNHRLLCLDVLRAAAMFLVLFSHASSPPREMWEPLRKGIVLLDHVGWIGVDLFFVLSGFLVSGLLFREHIKTGRFRIANFYIRRGFKIYPALYFLVLVSILIQTNVFGRPPPLRDIAGDLLFLQNYVGAVWGHTWSLAVEEHFYLLLPPVLLLFVISARGASNPFKYLPVFFVFVATAELGLRIYMNLAHDYGHGTHLFKSHLRFDSLLFGVMISYFYHYHSSDFVSFVKKWRMTFFIVLFVLLAPLLILQRTNILVPTIGLTLIYAMSGTVLCWLLTVQFPTNRITSSVGYIGLHSYSIYLWHYPMVYWVMEPMANAGFSWPVYTAVYLVISVIVGVFAARVIEFPVIYLRDKWFPAKRSHRETTSNAGALALNK